MVQGKWICPVMDNDEWDKIAVGRWMPAPKAPRPESFWETKARLLTARSFYWRMMSGSRFSGPVAQAQEFTDFASFVAVLFGFGGPVFHLTEGMFRVLYCFLNQVPRFCHTQFLHSFAAQPPTAAGCAVAGMTSKTAAGSPCRSGHAHY